MIPFDWKGLFLPLKHLRAIAYTMKFAPTVSKDKIIDICLSGSGDKDSFEVAKKLGCKI